MFKKKLILFFFIINFFNIISKIKTWDLTNYVWNLSIAQCCNKGLYKNPVQHFNSERQFNIDLYKNIQKNDIIFLRCRFVKHFYEQVLNSTSHPFILVICDGDESFPTNCGLDQKSIEEFINHKSIIHIFAQNCDYKGPSKKVSHIPIGIDFHTIAYKGNGWGEASCSPQEQEICLNKILNKLKPNYLRKKRAFVDFQLADTMRGEFKRFLEFGEDRASIFNYIVKTGLIDFSGRMKRSDLWKTKGEYAFSISPPGNGIDCHRTWEDLVLGCIVIVKTSSLDPIFEGLPVVIVKNWSEITEDNFKKWLNLYGDCFNNSKYREKLTNQYWINIIQQKMIP